MSWLQKIFGEKSRQISESATEELRTLSESMSADDVARVRGLIKAGADIDVKNGSGNTPLMMASRYGYTEIVKLLLNANADAKAPNNDGATPLLMVSAQGHTEIVKLLLNAKADPNAATDEGYTPLHAALYGGHKEIAQLLLNDKVDVNAAIVGGLGKGMTPLFLAIQHGLTEIVQLLLGAGADPNAALVGSKGGGMTPLILASSCGNTEIVQLLLNAKVDPNVGDNDGQTPLHSATSGGHVECVRLLLNAKADPYAALNDGRTPVLFADYGGSAEVAQVFRDHGVESDSPASDDSSKEGGAMLPKELSGSGKAESSQPVTNPALSELIVAGFNVVLEKCRTTLADERMNAILDEVEARVLEHAGTIFAMNQKTFSDQQLGTKSIIGGNGTTWVVVTTLPCVMEESAAYFGSEYPPGYSAYLYLWLNSKQKQEAEANGHTVLAQVLVYSDLTTSVGLSSIDFPDRDSCPKLVFPNEACTKEDREILRG